MFFNPSIHTYKSSIIGWNQSWTHPALYRRHGKEEIDWNWSIANQDAEHSVIIRTEHNGLYKKVFAKLHSKTSQNCEAKKGEPSYSEGPLYCKCNMINCWLLHLLILCRFIRWRFYLISLVIFAAIRGGFQMFLVNSWPFLLAPPSGQHLQFDSRNNRNPSTAESCIGIFSAHLFSLEAEPFLFPCSNGSLCSLHVQMLHYIFKRLKARCSAVYLPHLIRRARIKLAYFRRT